MFHSERTFALSCRAGHSSVLGEVSLRSGVDYSANHDKLYLIAGDNGLHEPGQGNQRTRLCDDVLYEFHIARGIGELNDAVTYQIRLHSTPPTPVDNS